MLPETQEPFTAETFLRQQPLTLEKGVKPEKFGPEILEPVRPEFALVKHKDGSVIGRVLHVDSFGNIITNINKVRSCPNRH